MNMPEPCVRHILPHAKDFAKFWKETGPFRYALTSKEYPPILLEPEEWIFGNDLQRLLKELMQFDQKKMAFVESPFNPKNKNILRPQELSPWKITHFPEQWNRVVCDAFVPEGHLTCRVMDKARNMETRNLEKPDPPLGCLKEIPGKQEIEKAFFDLLEAGLESMGYLLLTPQGNSKYAATKDYLLEWEEDDREAGLF
jgi:hypothetical protein